MEKRPKHEKANEILKSLEGFNYRDCKGILEILGYAIEREMDNSKFTYVKSLV